MNKIFLKILSCAAAVCMAAGAFSGCTAAQPETPSSGAPAEDPSSASVQEGGSEAPSSQPEAAEDMKADIVVIGAGGAGMAAAIEAAEAGATNIVILEKMPLTGGNTVRSTGGLNACATDLQKQEGIEDSVDLMVKDTMEGGHNLNDETLVREMAERSADAVTWVNSHGGDLSEVGMFGGASVKRIHKPTGGSAVGPMLVTMLNDNIKKLGIPVMLETKAEEILVDADGKICGVKASNSTGEITIDCKAVVLATGGFGANAEMVVKYKSDLQGFATTNHSGATGDGIAMAEKLGAAFVDLDQIQTHPTVNPETTDMYTEAVRGNGAVLINKEGKRFVNELETRDVVSAAILSQTDGICYLVFDQAVRDGLKAIEKYITAGIITEADSIEELAGKLRIDPAAMKATMDNYAASVTAGTDAEFARADMAQPLTAPKFYAGLCAPAIHHTMGGVKIDTSCQVLKEDGTLIPGLFAAGEVTGGVHGGNRLGGNAVTDIVVFGRVAGNTVNAYIQANGGNTQPTIQIDDSAAPATPQAQGNYKDGTYTGTGKGNGGDLTVEVVVKEGNVVSIALTDHKETEGIYEAAVKGVTAEIIRTQATQVEGVAGATKTSDGIKEAVANALEQAK